MFLGALGTVWFDDNENGARADVDKEAGVVPATLVAVTVKVYGVPLVSPETVQIVAPVVVQLWPPEEVTVYPVIGLPPVFTGWRQLTSISVLLTPADEVTPEGASGIVAFTVMVIGPEVTGW